MKARNLSSAPDRRISGIRRDPKGGNCAILAGPGRRCWTNRQYLKRRDLLRLSLTPKVATGIHLHVCLLARAVKACRAHLKAIWDDAGGTQRSKALHEEPSGRGIE